MRITFAAWMSAVDVQIGKLVGMSSMDLPDCCYRDWYDDGMTVRSAAQRAIRMAGGSF